MPLLLLSNSKCETLIASATCQSNKALLLFLIVLALKEINSRGTIGGVYSRAKKPNFVSEAIIVPEGKNGYTS